MSKRKYSDWKAAGQQREFERMHKKTGKKLDALVAGFRRK